MKAPIICGREPNASAEEKKLGSERSAELSAKVNQASIFSLVKFIHSTELFMMFIYSCYLMLSSTIRVVVMYFLFFLMLTRC
jgi:hypothetical protein